MDKEIPTASRKLRPELFGRVTALEAEAILAVGSYVEDSPAPDPSSQACSEDLQQVQANQYSNSKPVGPV